MPENNPKPVLHSILLSDRLRPELYRLMQGVDCQQVARSFQTLLGNANGMAEAHRCC